MGIIARKDDSFVEVFPCTYRMIENFGEHDLPENRARVIVKDKDDVKKQGILMRKPDGSYKEIVSYEYDKTSEILSHAKAKRLLSNEYIVVKDGIYGIIRVDESGSYEEVLPFAYRVAFPRELESDDMLHAPDERMVVNKEENTTIIRRTESGKWEEVLGEPFIEGRIKGHDYGALTKLLKENELFVDYEDGKNIIGKSGNDEWRKAFPHDFVTHLRKPWYEYDKDNRPLLMNMCEELINGRRMAFCNDMKNSKRANKEEGSLIRELSLRTEKEDHTFAEITDSTAIIDLMSTHEALRKVYIQTQSETHGDYFSLQPIVLDDGREIWAGGRCDDEPREMYEFLPSVADPYGLRVFSQGEIKAMMTGEHREKIEGARYLPF